MYYKTIKTEDGKYKTIKSESPIDGGFPACAWVFENGEENGIVVYTSFDKCPATEQELKNAPAIVINDDGSFTQGVFSDVSQGYVEAYYTESEERFHIGFDQWFWYHRDPTKDFSFGIGPGPQPTSGATLYAYQEWEDNDWGYYVLYTTKENVEVGDYLTEIDEGGYSSKNEITAIDSETGIVTTSHHDYKHNPELDIVFD